MPCLFFDLDQIGSSALIDKQKALQQTEIFADLPAAILDQLADAARRHTANTADLIFRQGESATTFYLLLAGRVRLVQHSLEGKDVTMSTFVPGDVIGIGATLSGETYPGSAEALEPVELLGLPGSIMWQVMNECAPLAVHVLRFVVARLHEAHDHIRELSAERVQQRIARSLVRLARKVGLKQADGSICLDLRLSRQDLAQMNGATLETVSRILSAWEREGIVDSRREQIIILKPHALVVIAEDLPR
jgi:CRP-like cAMP-binding protein